MKQSIQFHGNDYEKMGFQRLENDQEILWKCPKIIGQGFLHAIVLRSDFQLLIRDFEPRETVTMTFEEETLPLIFSFLLSGGVHNDLKQGLWKKQFSFTSGQTSLTSFPIICGRCVHPAGEHMKMINIWISENMLKSLLNGFVEDQREIDTLLIKGAENPLLFGTITPAFRTALFDIVNCPFHGAIRRLFLESKCMELICYQLAQINAAQVHAKSSKPLSNNEVERIHHARDLLIADLQNPPSIDILSKTLGTNNFTLRQGFRKVFGTTIFEQLRRQRLIQAKTLLERSHLNVAEVASQVGYSDLKHFYKAFKNQFHTTPGACRTYTQNTPNA